MTFFYNITYLSTVLFIVDDLVLLAIDLGTFHDDFALAFAHPY